MDYSLKQIAEISGSAFEGADTRVTRAITDSRTFPVDGATLFTAIRTASRDGHDYVGELYARGVRGFIVGRDFDCSPYPEAGFVKAGDTIAALQSLAAHYRGSFRGRVVGITGSYGKTIVKEWIAQLTPAGKTLFRSPKSYNSQIGVPLSILMADGGEDYIVVEAGISEPGEMAALRRMIRPDMGIITSTGGAHAANFPSEEAYLDEKLDLFEGCPRVIFNGPEAGEALRKRFPDAEIIDASQAAVPDMDDEFSRRNARTAVCFWRSEGFDPSAAAIESLLPVAMRLEVREGLYNSVLINDTYNSDINSLAIALDFLNRTAGTRPRTAIASDILSAGPSEEETYARAARLVEGAGIECFVGIGPRMTLHAHLFGPGSSFHATADDFLRSITSDDIQGRAILLKGGAQMQFDRIGHALERKSHTTVMEIDLDAMIHNLRLCRRRLAPGVGLMAMIKASAYGHGSFEVANTLQQQGVDYLAVAFADEGVALRESGVTMPIVVLNADADSFDLMIRHRLEPEIYNFVSFDRFTDSLKRHGEQRYPIHVKIDTGMHRLGFTEPDVAELKRRIARAERYVRVSSVFSHLAAADDPAQDDFTRRQIASFDEISRAVAAPLLYPVRRHLANTVGAERFPESHFDMVRLGIGLYGIGMEGAHRAATLKTRIVSLTPLAAGETVGYNRRGVLERDSLIATIPIGYADGLSRRLGEGKWSVLIAGQRAPIVGSVCMDSIMVDATGIEGAAVGDDVMIFSPAPGNTVEDMARSVGTIPYEILTLISSRVKRIYTKE